MSKSRTNKGRKKAKSKKPRHEETPWADGEDMMYAIIMRKSGGMHMPVFCSDGVERKMFLRNGIRLRTWFNEKDIVLVSKRSGMTDNGKVDAIHKYSASDKGALIASGDLEFAIGRIGAADDYKFVSTSETKEERLHQPPERYMVYSSSSEED